MTSIASSRRNHVSNKASRFTESVIREMTREALKHGAVNLSQGFPDFPAPEDIKARAMQAIADDVNQYAITWGARDFRQAIARKTEWYLGLTIDPETEITVTCGSTEGMIAAMMATVDPGEEVIVFEPFYENYGPDAILSDARPRYVSLARPIGVLTEMNSARPSTRRRKPSSSATRTTRPAKSSHATKWNSSHHFVKNTTRSASQTKSTSTFSIHAKARKFRTSRWRSLKGCAKELSSST